SPRPGRAVSGLGDVRPMAADAGGRLSAILGADRLAPGNGAEVHPDLLVDRVADEPDAAVAEEGVDARGVAAPGGAEGERMMVVAVTEGEARAGEPVYGVVFAAGQDDGAGALLRGVAGVDAAGVADLVAGAEREGEVVPAAVGRRPAHEGMGP